MRKTLTVLFSGGGSLGHLVPSLAVAEALRKIRPDIRTVFVCADREEEMQRLTEKSQRFHALRAPKFPRGLSLSILTFPFLFLVACIRAKKILTAEKPDLVFSKGGFVSVPVCVIAAMKKIPIVLHESDGTMSLSARIVARLAVKICTGFPSIGLPERFSSRIRHTGNPVRREMFSGSKAAGQRITGFSGRRPVLMILGGSQGSIALNEAAAASLPSLLEYADIIHITGVGKGIDVSHARYFARETVSDELPHLYALADAVLSRAGAGTLCELGVLRKAAIVVPLTGVAHDHQLRNAEFLAKKHALVLLPQANLRELSTVVARLLSDEEQRHALGGALHDSFPPDAAEKIARIILAELDDARLES